MRHHKLIINDDSHPNFFCLILTLYAHDFSLKALFWIFTFEKNLNFSEKMPTSERRNIKRNEKQNYVNEPHKAAWKSDYILGKLHYLVCMHSTLHKFSYYIKFIYFDKATFFLRNLHRRFVLCRNGQIYDWDFAEFCGLLRIYELNYVSKMGNLRRNFQFVPIFTKMTQIYEITRSLHNGSTYS